MPRGKKLSEDYLDEVFSKVSAYQSEHKCSINKACIALSKEFNVNPKTLNHQFKKSRGINRVVSTRIAATAITKPSVHSMEIQKTIYDFIKSRGFIKRILCCIIGLDKLCQEYTHKQTLIG